MKNPFRINSTFLFLLILPILLFGCSQGTPVSAQPSPTKTHTSEPIPLPATEISMIDEKPTDQSRLMPDMLLYISNSQTDTCGKEQVYLFDSNKELKQILFDRNKNYRYPKWSPDGEWIAYVESIPIIEDDGNINSGSDSIWVENKDRSIRKKVSIDVPNRYYWFEYNDDDKNIKCCYYSRGIMRDIHWSYDNRYIAFETDDRNKGEHRHYVIDVEEQRTVTLPGGKDGYYTGWAPSTNTLAVTYREWVSIYGINSIDDISYWYKYYPDEYSWVSLPESLRFAHSYSGSSVQFLDDDTIIGSFLLVSKISRDLAIWELDLSTKKWGKIMDTPDMDGPLLGNESILTCGADGSLLILDKGTMEVISTYAAKEYEKSICSWVKLFQNKSYGDVISIYGEKGDAEGIWVAEVGEDINPWLYFDFDQLDMEIVYLISYSWRSNK